MAIVGDGTDDAESWSTLGTVGEGIAMAAFDRVQHFACAIVANCRVRRDLGACQSVAAIDDTEPRASRLGAWCDLDLVDLCLCWWCVHQPVDQFGNGRGLASDMDQDAFGIVPHITREAALPCEAPDRGTETHALHATAHTNLSLLHPS